MGPVGEPASMYGAVVAGPALPWDWARERLVAARNYWLATARPAGAPHVRPVWGVWRAEGLYLATGNRAVRVAEAGGPAGAHLENGDRVVVVDGTLARVRDQALIGAVLADYNGKYAWDAEPTEEGMRDSAGASGAVLLLRPVTVFGWDIDEPARSTRWTQGDPAEVAW